LLLQNAVKCVAAGGHYLASGGGDDQIHLYDIKVSNRSHSDSLLQHSASLKPLGLVTFCALANMAPSRRTTRTWVSWSTQPREQYHAYASSALKALALPPPTCSVGQQMAPLLCGRQGLAGSTSS
jgi:hypothetical protein